MLSLENRDMNLGNQPGSSVCCKALDGVVSLAAQPYSLPSHINYIARVSIVPVCARLGTNHNL